MPIALMQKVMLTGAKCDLRITAGRPTEICLSKRTKRDLVDVPYRGPEYEKFEAIQKRLFEDIWSRHMDDGDVAVPSLPPYRRSLPICRSTKWLSFWWIWWDIGGSFRRESVVPVQMKQLRRSLQAMALAMSAVRGAARLRRHKRCSRSRQRCRPVTR